MTCAARSAWVAAITRTSTGTRVVAPTRRTSRSYSTRSRLDCRAALQPQAQNLAQRFCVPQVDAQTVQIWAHDTDRTLFLCDVRTAEEFKAGTLPGAQHTPGGQLMQAMDQFVGVRAARLVLFDSDGVRAPVVASWLRQMGHDASVLVGSLQSGLALSTPAAAQAPQLATITAPELARRIQQDDVVVVDLRPGMQYRAAHIPGARWSIRPRLAQALASESRQVVLVADETEVAQWAALELPQSPLLLEGGLAAWQQACQPVESSPDCPSDAECIDYLFFVHDRHDGNKDAARQYLAWETGLVAQLDALELAAFRLPESASAAVHTSTSGVNNSAL